MNSSPLLIIGAGGHGAEVAAYAVDMDLPLAGAIDDGKPRGAWHVTQIIGGIGDLPAFCRAHDEVCFITAFGDNVTRKKVITLIAALELHNLKASILQHSCAWTGSDVYLGEGTLLAPGSLVTTRAYIGKHTILNVKASVAHDCRIGDFCNINPSATICGDVELGEGCYVGAGATVMEKRRIGEWTVIGAGSVVTRDLPSGVTAVGVPARIIKQQGLPSIE